MKKLSLIALLAAGVFALYTAPSFAAAALTAPPKPKDPVCLNCTPPGDEPTSPGDPFNPNDPNGDGGPDDGGPDDGGPDDGGPNDGGPNDGGPNDGGPNDGSNPNDPNGPSGGLNKADVAQLNACLVRLDGLPAVSVSEIQSFGDPSKVSLTPVCEVKSLTESETALVEKGNVIGLEGALKANAFIRTKLGETAYKAGDVVGIDFDEKGNAILFVHKMRG